MVNRHKTRELESREYEDRDVYVPPSALPDPTPDPDWAFRWVAIAVNATPDLTNASKRFREGWVPVRAEDHPELGIAANSAGNVEIGGLLLCKMPKGKAKARDRFYEQQSAAQMESVDSTYLRNNDSRMPLFAEKRSEVTRGGGFGNGSK